MRFRVQGCDPLIVFFLGYVAKPCYQYTYFRNACPLASHREAKLKLQPNMEPSHAHIQKSALDALSN